MSYVLNETSLEEERYDDMGGIYFPILQQDGKRVITKVGDGKDRGDLHFLDWLRQHDRQLGAQV